VSLSKSIVLEHERFGHLIDFTCKISIGHTYVYAITIGLRNRYYICHRW